MTTTDFLAKYKMWLIIAVTVVIIIAIVYFVGRKKGREARKDVLPEKVTKGIDNTEARAAEEFADKLYQDMKGLNFWSHDMDLWNAFLRTTDRIMIATSNYFNQKYGKSKTDTLYQWLKDEWNINFWGGAFKTSETWKIVRPQVLKRMEQLGLN